MTVQLVTCAGAIYVFFIAWSYLQEKINTTPYAAAPSDSLLGRQGAAEFFRSPLLLNWLQASFSTLVAVFYLLVATGSSSGKSGALVDRLGLSALTAKGAQRIRKQPAQKAKEVERQGRNGKTPNGTFDKQPTVSDAAATSVSPLLFRYLLVAALQSCSSQLGLLSLAHGISYPTLTLAKSCKLVPVLMMNVLLYRRKFPAYKYLVVLLVTLGIAAFMLFSAESERKRAKGGGKGDSLIGVALLSMNLLFDGATNSTQDEIFHRYTVTGPQMMLVMNALSSLLMGASLLVPLHALPVVGDMLGSKGGANELSTALAFVQRHPTVVKDLLAYSAAGAIGQVAIFETLQRFGSLTLVSITVSVCAKKKYDTGRPAIADFYSIWHCLNRSHANCSRCFSQWSCTDTS